MTAVVIVPVFNAPEATARCLEALERTTASDTEVVVIDDASTDPRMSAVFERLPASWRLLENARNLGFVATANRGMQAAGQRDVVLLNSDAVPAGDWLERIRACAATDPAIASITPFSNNGEIASIPEFCRANPVPEDPELWARACRDAGPPVYPELPTAVGFCMYLRRRCLDRIGPFDAEAFGAGYGEENDWCLRATSSGWKHVLCDDAFVAHQGNASFGPLGLKPDQDSMRRLLRRHPDYLETIQAFIEADPVRPARERVLRTLHAG